MTPFEVIVVGPFYLFVAAGIMYVLTPALRTVSDARWIGEASFIASMALAGCLVWVVTNFPDDEADAAALPIEEACPAP